MTPPTPEELLRLARKAWPDTAADLREPGEDDPLSVDYAEHDCTARVHNPYEEDSIALTITHPERAQQALHAALLVLSGELDVAALLKKAQQLCQHADDMASGGAREAAYVVNAEAPGIGDYLRGQRDLLRIYADSFRKLLPKEDP